MALHKVDPECPDYKFRVAHGPTGKRKAKSKRPGKQPARKQRPPTPPPRAPPATPAGARTGGAQWSGNAPSYAQASVGRDQDGSEIGSSGSEAAGSCSGSDSELGSSSS